MDDRFVLRLSSSRALEHAGRFGEASTLLSDLLGEVDDERGRARLHCDIARLALEQVQKVAARHHLERARSLGAARDDVLTRGHVEALAGAVALNEEDPSEARRYLARSAMALRSCIGGPNHERASEVLARLLVDQSSLYVFAGNLEDAADAAAEADRRLSALAFPDQAVRLAARFAIAAATAYNWSNRERAEAEMRACYRAATQQGFVALAADIGIWLALIYRYTDRQEAALELFAALLPSVRTMSQSRVKASFFISAANVLSEAGNVRLAMDMISEAAGFAFLDDRAFRAQFYLASTRVHILTGDLAAALEASQEAERSFAELNRVGLVGATLLVRGKALLAMGRPKDATTIIRHSIDALSLAGYPGTLLRARRTLGAIQTNPSVPAAAIKA